MSLSGCKFILKQISCTHLGRKYVDVGKRLQKNFFAHTAAYSIYFAKMKFFKFTFTSSQCF